MVIANLIRTIGLPWLMLGDFNRTPVETASSTWCMFLRGVVTAPRVPFTCTNNSEQGGSLIDYATHSDDLAPYLDIEGIQDFPFKPHVISIKATIHREVSPGEAYVIDVPTEISQSFGPRNFKDDWRKHWAKAEGVVFETTVPISGNASEAASNLYAKFGFAAESYLLSTFPDATIQHFDRASKITFKKVKASLAN